MIAVLAEHPEMRAHLERVGDVSAAEQSLRAELRALLVEQEALLAAWREEADAARQELRPVPEPPPESPEIRAAQDALRACGVRAQRLTEERQRLLASLASMVEAEWQTARQDLATGTVEALAALVPLLETWREWHRALKEVRTAVDNDVPGGGRVTNGPSTRMPHRLTLSNLCVLAEHPDADLLKPAPLPPPPPGAVQVDRGEPEVLRVQTDPLAGMHWLRR